jgi:tRNA U34 2-thiouridine synthase MnmA/TrmU
MSNWNASDENSSLEDHSESNNRGQGRGRGSCEQSERDATDAQQAADFLGIKMARVGFESEYWHGVFEPFIEGLGEDRTINPDGKFESGSF